MVPTIMSAVIELAPGGASSWQCLKEAEIGRERERDRERKIKSISADSREDSENLRKVEIWRSSAIWKESQKSVGKVLEEYWKNFGRVAFSYRFKQSF